MIDAIPPVHLRLRDKVDESTRRRALRATLSAVHLLGLAIGTHLRHLRGMRDPLTQLQARVGEAELRTRLALEIVEILSARFGKIPERRRPYFTPVQRFRILEIRSLLAWSAADTARAFLVCPHTILNWEKAVDTDMGTVGSTVAPKPPIRRAADSARRLVQLLCRLGFGGQDLLSRILARAGWRVSARSVGRYRKERLRPEPPPELPRAARPVVARFVHHVWMLDVSQVKQFLGPDLHLAALFDAYSRMPLALRVFAAKPAARDMASLLHRAVRCFVRPRHVITDLGGEFTAGVFRSAVRRIGAVQRFASRDSLYATARLERFWRTLKENACLYRLVLPLTAQDLERRLDPALLHYACFRPHEGLRGATPAEAFLGIDPACHKAVSPPRGRAGEGPPATPFKVDFLDEARRFPIFKAAA